jgi:hypothetical protein
MFNLIKLEGKIISVFGSLEVFANISGIRTKKLQSKLKSTQEFSLSEMQRIVQILGIPVEEVSSYFFELKAEKAEAIV